MSNAMLRQDHAPIHHNKEDFVNTGTCEGGVVCHAMEVMKPEVLKPQLAGPNTTLETILMLYLIFIILISLPLSKST